MNPFFVAFDIVLVAISLRSVAVLGTRAPWTSAGWLGTVGYGIAAVVEFSLPAVKPAAALTAYLFVALLTVTFVIAGVRDEPQAEPWWWPVRIGRTRAQKRRDETGNVHR